MIKLIESGLFGNSLIPIENKSLVDRYNTCLDAIGLAKTKLTKFHIDGWGWSPEIAEEQGDRFYLSHGLANPYGIILTPDQANSSIYMPFHSFDRNIHQIIFTEYIEQIRDVTARSAMWFEVDQEISAYRAPQDLLMMDYVKIHFHAVDGVMDAAKEQRALIREFYEKPHAWSDDELRSKIIESSKNYGDLRFSKFAIPSTPFNDISHFYTLAFDGLYVFKKLSNGKPLMIYQSDKSNTSGESKHDHIEFNVNDPKLIGYLIQEGLISNDLTHFDNYTQLLKVMHESMFVSALTNYDPELDFASLNRNQLKGVLNRMIVSGHLSDDYFDMERLLAKIKEGQKISSSEIPESLFPYLLHPTEKSEGQQRLVIWQLLSNLNKTNPVLHYLFDKSDFYMEYRTWSDAKQRWAIDKIVKHKDIYHQLV